jgi:hypothetical protein
MGDDKTSERAEEIESGIEGALGHATADEQTHSENDQTGGEPAPPEKRDENAATD